MKLNLIFGIAVLSVWGLSYTLGLNSLDVSLHIEAKKTQQEPQAFMGCNSGWVAPEAGSGENSLSSTLKLSLSADSTAVGLYFQGLKQWLEIGLNGQGSSTVNYGNGWQRRSL
ncbi:MAG: hypothetical protein H6560_08050 [Lewinellaceae bacterium]|nr:hypothetical protein [Lewinellaceae bacterium]